MDIPRLLKIRGIAALTLAITCLMFFIVSAGATTLIYKNFDALVSEAEAIVVGTVRQAESHYGPGRIICTFVTLTNLQVIHGDYNKNALVIRLEGGMVEGHGQELVGSPIFKQGESVLVFIRGNGKRMVPIVGWTQGVFKISRDSATQEDLITDYAENRIFGLENNDLIKERRRSKEADAKAEDSSPGVTEKGTIPEIVSIYSQSPNTEPWSAAKFIDAINERIILNRKPSSAVKSVNVMDFSNLQLLRNNRKE